MIAVLRSVRDFALPMVWPGVPGMLRSYPEYHRLRAAIFFYNLIIMTATFELSRQMLSYFVLPQDIGFRTQAIRWTEGFIRYSLWTLANLPLVITLRRRLDLDMTLAGRLPGLESALLFARPFFWASLIANFVNGVGTSLTLSYTSVPVVDWLRGMQSYRDPTSVIRDLNELLHIAAVSLFRAGAISYALFGGFNVLDAMKRVFLAYGLGGILLFGLFDVGERIGTITALQMHQNRIEALELRRDEGVNAIQRARKMMMSEFRPTYVNGLRVATHPPSLHERIAGSFDVWGFDFRKSYDQRILRLQNLRRQYVFFVSRFWLLPYYSVCVGGAWIFLMLARRNSAYRED